MAVDDPHAVRPRLGPTIGIDLGGTKIEAMLIDRAGRVVSNHRWPTNADLGAATVIAEIAQGVTDFFATQLREVAGLGVGVAGQVDAVTGVVHFAPNLRWENVPLRAELERALGLPVAVTNDVRAATWGEWRCGAGAGVADLVVLFVGTGIGGGVVSGGRMLVGHSNTAGEVGHTTVVANGRQCHCRNRGCLEAYAGGWAIGERAQQAAQADPAAGATLVALAGGLDGITAGTVSAAYGRGDALARRLVEEVGAYLGAGAVSLVNAFNPARLVLGGGVIDGLPDLLPIIERDVREHALPTAVDGLEVVAAALGNQAPAIGAAALAREAGLGTGD